MWTVIGSILIVAATIIAGMWADRRWKLLPAGGDGETRQSAIRATPRDIERLRRTQRCRRCGNPLDSAADDTVKLDDVVLRVLRFTCARCGEIRNVYVREVSA